MRGGHHIYIYMHIYIYIYTYVYVHIHIYIEREIDTTSQLCTYVYRYVSLCLPIYLSILLEGIFCVSPEQEGKLGMSALACFKLMLQPLGFSLVRLSVCMCAYGFV